MKKIVFISTLLLIITSVFSQDRKIESLDSFFAGVPLQQTFEKWENFISTHPQLGIDSITERGIYSSFKPGMQSNFPFPENCNVKILFAEEVVKFTKYKNDLGFDTVKAIMIEGVFENSVKGRQDAYKCYLALKKSLTQHYKKSHEWTTYSIDFWNGKNSNFPPCMLNKGYHDFLKFPYVIISLVDGKYLKDIFPLKISQHVSQ